MKEQLSPIICLVQYLDEYSWYASNIAADGETGLAEDRKNEKERLDTERDQRNKAQSTDGRRERRRRKMRHRRAAR